MEHATWWSKVAYLTKIGQNAKVAKMGVKSLLIEIWPLESLANTLFSCIYAKYTLEKYSVLQEKSLFQLWGTFESGVIAI